MAFARQILSRSPEVKIVVLSAILDREHLDMAIEAGVAAYVLKVNVSSELINAIRAVRRGETYVCSEVSALLVGGYRELLAADGRSGDSALSEREREVLKLIADGRNTKEIAGELGVSIKTIETHRSRLMARLGMHSVAELTKYAVRKGISSL